MSGRGRGRPRKTSTSDVSISRGGHIDSSSISTRSMATTTSISSSSRGQKRAAAAIENDSSSNESDDHETKPLTAELSGQGQVQLKPWKDFAVTGKLDSIPLMVIDIQDYGPLTFPIYSDKIVEELRPFMDKSDYSVGQGKRLIYDPSVRSSSEISSSRIRINNSSWTNYMKDTILPTIGGELGFNHLTTRADLRKLLIYEKGSFFAAREDVVQEEKGHFGTMIIQLPSRYSGGELKCSYGRLEKVFDHSSCKEIDVKVYGPSSENVYTMDVNPSDTFRVIKSKISNQSSKNGIPENRQGYIFEQNDFVRDDRSVADFDLELPLAGNDLCGFYSAFYTDVKLEVENVTSGIRSCLVYKLIDTTTTSTTTIGSQNQSVVDKKPDRPTLSLEFYQEMYGD